MAGIADAQQPDGMVPWWPGGHADPWNHVEAAMALDVGGRRRAAEAAYGWLARSQRPDGAWHQYYVAGGIEEPTLDANVTAYVAAGVWHHVLITGDTAFLDEMWPVVEAAVGFVLDLQTVGGEVLWARDAGGAPSSYALLTTSSSIYHSLRCAVAAAHRLGRERPEWELAAASLGAAILTRPDAFRNKDRWAMDWYYPVLAGVLTEEAGRERLREGRSVFVMEGLGTRCVSDHPWITAAETCECALAHLAAGEIEVAHRLFGWIQHLHDPAGGYFTGMVHPQRVHFPAREQATYSAAAVILAADALYELTPGSGLFRGKGLPEVPPIVPEPAAAGSPGPMAS
ncbi:MAG TPA: prenyltransferase [Chloroflexota bacterium]|nr:prenyltransferase [Chloroflexota bacterium]